MPAVLVEAPALRRYWYVVAEAGDIESRPQAVRLLGDDIVIWRGPGAMLIAAPDRCPHREAPLSEGHVVDGCLECCYHGWTFGAEGRCVRVPSAAVQKRTSWRRVMVRLLRCSARAARLRSAALSCSA